MGVSLHSHTRPVSEVDPYRPGPWAVVRWTLWFGIVSGTLELAVFLLKCHYLDPRNYNVSRHFPWMYPVAGMVILSGPGLVLALAAWRVPRRVTPAWVLGLLSFVALVGLLFRCPIYTAVCLLLAAGLALRTAPWLAARARGFDRLVRRSLPVLALLLAAAVLACFGRAVQSERGANARLPHAAPAARNVILIVLDTVRARSLSLYDYHRQTSPNLAKLAARGVRYDRAYATAPWTAPSHASMFTGRWCHELTVGWNRPLDRTSPTLAGFLRDQGYATAGFVGNTTYCSYETGLDRGFTHYEDYDVSLRAVLLCSALVQRTLNFLSKHPELAGAGGPSGPEPDPEPDPGPAAGSGHRKSAARINRDFLAWLDQLQQRDPARPFFAFLNYYDAHHPYLVPDRGAGPRLCRIPASTADARLLKSWWEIDKHRLKPDDVALARDSYDQCIAYLDHQLGRLFAALEERGVLDRSLVVVTADHGEHFGEQDLFGHGCSLYLPELHVPLVIVPPAGAGKRSGHVVTAPVSLRNLAATIVAAAGLPAARESPFPGSSLLPLANSGPDATASRPEPILSELEAPPEADPNQGRSPVCRGPLASLVDGGLHYIHSADGREELYDLLSDPGETRNLVRTVHAARTLQHFRALLRGYPRSTVWP